DGVPGGRVPGARAGARAERGELRAGAGGRRRARVRGAAPPRRHRAADGRLRLPRARARDGRHGGGERALRRRAARGARMTPLFARLTIAGGGLVGCALRAGVGPVVGAHPIAGSEASGAGAARADLFRGRRCILTPTPATDRAALARVRALWEGVGARVEEMPPAVHDELLARVSHLPHLL